jgi:hypothetical protein
MSSGEQFDKTWVSFEKIYTSLYPEDKNVDFSSQENKNKASMYITMVVWWEILNEGYTVSIPNYPFLRNVIETQNTLDPQEFRKWLTIWLLYGCNFDNFRKTLVALIVEKNDKSLNVSDYAFLLYISSKEIDNQLLLNNMPSTLLHDMLDPIARNNFDAWMAK